MVNTGKRLNVVAFVIQLATIANIMQAGSQTVTAGDSVPSRGTKFLSHRFPSLIRALT